MSRHSQRPDLVRDWEMIRARYGLDADPDGVGRIDVGLLRRVARIRHLEERRRDIDHEIKTLAAEVAGLEATLQAVVEAAVERVRTEHGEGWSPVPILGFRLWDVRADGFHGFRVRWQHHILCAECPTSGTKDEVPHTDGRCGQPPCGIYAAKDIDALLSAHVDHDQGRLGAGLVGLTGKVVEHERGYRGAKAEVLALAFPRDDVLHLTADPGEIATIFEGSSLPDLVGHRIAPLRLSDQGGSAVQKAIKEFLTKEERRRTSWTSEIRNG